MVFNDLDKSATLTLCTLANLVGDDHRYEESLIMIGQYLGLSKDDIEIILNDWDETDLIDLESKQDKIEFVRNCFAFVGKKPGQSPESELYRKVLKSLDLNPIYLN